MAGEREEYIAVLKALYDYEPASEDEVAIKEDQIVFLIERTDDDWWKVKGKPESQEDESTPSGLVPASYLQEAEPASVVKALYDYEALAVGELSISEEEVLTVYDKDDDWLLVKSERDGGKVGYVPGNYVEESTGDEKPTETDASQIVIPDSPPQRPTSVYVDPADRVAATVGKAKADDIQTWSVSEVDKKGKKKKGTLGIGNGAIFFASESDKMPVQKWQTSAIDNIKVEKSKHLHLEIGGATPTKLHFNVGSKDTSDAIVTKLESSKQLAASVSPSSTQPSQVTPSPEHPGPPPLSVTVPAVVQKPNKNGASVHFAPAPAMIPSPVSPVDADLEEEDIMTEGESGTALYDFVADGDDELSVKEGEQLIILDKASSDEWWKCRNIHGEEGVVPASYVEIAEGLAADEEDEENDTEEQERIAHEEAERIAAEAAVAEAQARERAEKERERNKREADRKSKAAAAAAAAKAEKERKDRETLKLEERAAQEREAQKRLAEATRRNNSEKSTSSTDSQTKFPNEGKTRLWHDHSGQWRTEAEFLGVNKGKIRLHKINGVIIEVPPEKMSLDDIRYIESITNMKLGVATTPRPGPKDEDDIPLGAISQRRSQHDVSPAQKVPPKKAHTIDWFEFFLNAGCEIDDCTRYASSFERDKMDESILPDIKESTLRSLGLREGDIIRVGKAIEQRKAKASGPNDDPVEAQLARDEQIARALQAEEDSGMASRRMNTAGPPNLFAGPGGALKTQQRRGRPQPRGSAPPVNVDANSIASASDQISRTSSPLVASPSVSQASPTATAQPPKRVSSAQTSGFDDDAWTNRPSSSKPTPTPTPTPPVTASVSPSAPTPPSVPVSTPPAVPVTSAPPAPPLPVASVVPPQVPQPPRPTSANLTQSTQDPGQFELLAKIGQMRPPSAPAMQPSALERNPAIPLQGFHMGLGVGGSPLALGQHLQNQQTGLYPPLPNGPRGPLAPILGNQGLLNPLIPTNTGFNQFVPTRPASNPSFQPAGQPSFQPSFLSAPGQGPLLPPQPGFGTVPSLVSQPTGFPGVTPLTGNFAGVSTLPTGYGISGSPNFMPPNGFAAIPSNPTGLNPSFSQPMLNSGGLIPPRPSSPPKDHSPANVFARMKSGTFGDDNAAPQAADKYDALRHTGWQNGF